VSLQSANRLPDLPGLDGLAAVGAWPAVTELLTPWLPAQRWFAGKHRGLAELSVADAGPAPGVCVLLVDAVDATGDVQRYTVPVSSTAEPSRLPTEAVIGQLHGLTLVDACAHIGGARALTALVRDGTTVATTRGGRLVGAAGAGPAATAAGVRPPSPDAPSQAPELDHFPVSNVATNGQAARSDGGAGADAAVRALSAGSNTVVDIGEDTAVKLYRRPRHAPSCEIELTAALTAEGCDHVPSLRGAVVHVGRDGTVSALAGLTGLVAPAWNGWDLARAELARVCSTHDDGEECLPAPSAVSAETAQPSLLHELAPLGRAVATTHRALANRFPPHPVTGAESARMAQTMQSDAREVLTRATGVDPRLDARGQEVLDRLSELAPTADAGVVGRVHGDLHLGQTLRDTHGRWWLLDFEGEPARGIASRRAASPPLRDVAGMLRSLDYAAAAVDSPAATTPGPQRRWRDAARQRFLTGYLGSASGLVPEQPDAVRRLLAAFELDKAVYEVGYELANRPEWLPIPVEGLLGCLDIDQPG
jgi:predicted trehalose synthase